jgi:hypothetical protein
MPKSYIAQTRREEHHFSTLPPLVRSRFVGCSSTTVQPSTLQTISPGRLYMLHAAVAITNSYTYSSQPSTFRCSQFNMPLELPSTHGILRHCQEDQRSCTLFDDI